jgi:hypothetical protein
LIALHSERLLVGERTLAGHVSNELDLLRLGESLSLRGWEGSHVREVHLTWLMKMLLLDRFLLEDHPLWLIYKIGLAWILCDLRILANVIQNWKSGRTRNKCWSLLIDLTFGNNHFAMIYRLLLWAINLQILIHMLLPR